MPRLPSGLRIAFLVTAVVFAAAPHSLRAQAAEELIYSGLPAVRVSGSPGALTEETLKPDEANRYRLRIVRRGEQYYWASREDRQLTREESGPFVIFSCPAGIVKVVNPMFDAARQPLRATDPTERFDYVEIMHQFRNIVAYWGSGSGQLTPP
jgi:hypothetical protein